MINTPWKSHKSEAYQHQLASRPAGAVMIFTRSRNTATGDNSIYCMIPDPFPHTAFGKWSVTPDYKKSTETSKRMITKFVSIGSYSPEVRTFGTLITSTIVFSLIICKNI